MRSASGRLGWELCRASKACAFSFTVRCDYWLLVSGSKSPGGLVLHCRGGLDSITLPGDLEGIATSSPLKSLESPYHGHFYYFLYFFNPLILVPPLSCCEKERSPWGGGSKCPREGVEGEWAQWGFLRGEVPKE